MSDFAKVFWFSPTFLLLPLRSMKTKNFIIVRMYESFWKFLILTSKEKKISKNTNLNYESGMHKHISVDNNLRKNKHNFYFNNINTIEFQPSKAIVIIFYINGFNEEAKGHALLLLSFFFSFFFILFIN